MMLFQELEEQVVERFFALSDKIQSPDRMEISVDVKDCKSGST